MNSKTDWARKQPRERTPGAVAECAKTGRGHRKLAGMPALLVGVLWFSAACSFLPRSTSEELDSSLPVRGIHLSAPSKRDLPAALNFIREVLPKEGVSTLVPEFGFNYNFQSRPEFANPSALGKQDVQKIVVACRENRIQLIPQTGSA